MMSATQPSSKNISLFRVGTPKSLIMAEFGAPTGTQTKSGKVYEIYAFKNGVPAGVKATKAFCWAAADVLTLGLAEVVGTPVESMCRSVDHAYEVSYNKDNIVDSVTTIK